MDWTVSVNLWFLVSLCLVCLLTGLLYGSHMKKQHVRESLHSSELLEMRDRDRDRFYDRDRRYR